MAQRSMVQVNNCYFDFSDEAEEVRIPVPWGHVAGMNIFHFLLETSLPLVLISEII